MPSLAFDAVWINGSVGTGKTTTADQLGTELERRGVSGAVLDVDWLRRAWPAPADDRFNNDVALVNLRAVAGNFRERRARVIVAAGVIEDPDQVARNAVELGAVRMLHVRLILDPGAASARLRARHGDDATLDWYLRRQPELAGILDRAGFRDELVIDATALTPEKVAGTIAAIVVPSPAP